MKVVASLCLSLSVLCTTPARADAVTDWNVKSCEIIAETRLATQPAVRVMAIVQTAAHRAVVTASQRGASVEAALAASHRVSLVQLLPAQQPMVDAVYQAALGTIADNATKLDGIADGEAAAHAVLAARADDGAAAPETYRPHTTAGAYVTTTTPAVTRWPQRKPWLMRTAAQFRPACVEQRDLGARLQRSQGDGRACERAPQRRANRRGALLGLLGAADLPRARALGGVAARA